MIPLLSSLMMLPENLLRSMNRTLLYNSSTDFNLTYDASSLLTGVKSDYNSNTFKYTAGGQLEEVTTTGGFYN